MEVEVVGEAKKELFKELRCGGSGGEASAGKAWERDEAEATTHTPAAPRHEIPIESMW